MVKVIVESVLLGSEKVLENNGAKLIRSCLETPDGTILQSRSRHDYRQHLDANGKTYMLDGGLSYVRCSAHGDEIHHCVWNDDPFDKIREAMEWGSYGPKGDQPLTYKKLCDMSTEHIEAVLKNVSNILPQFREAFDLELKLRDSEDASSFIASNN